MNITTEQDLYERVAKRLEYVNSLEKNTEERNGRTLYLVGEDHGSRDPIDYVHKEIIPMISSNPKSWMMIREGLDSFKGFSDEDLLESIPYQFYFMKLPQVTGVKGEDVVKSPLDNEVKASILRNSPLNEKDVNSWYLVNWIFMNQGLSEQERRDAERNLAAKFGKEVSYISRVFEHASQPEGALVSRRVHELLMPAWNTYARSKLDEVLTQNSERTNVLVSVGRAHLPAFSDKYTYIG